MSLLCLAIKISPGHRWVSRHCKNSCLCDIFGTYCTCLDHCGVS